MLCNPFGSLYEFERVKKKCAPVKGSRAIDINANSLAARKEIPHVCLSWAMYGTAAYLWDQTNVYEPTLEYIPERDAEKFQLRSPVEAKGYHSPKVGFFRGVSSFHYPRLRAANPNHADTFPTLSRTLFVSFSFHHRLCNQFWHFYHRPE